MIFGGARWVAKLPFSRRMFCLAAVEAPEAVKASMWRDLLHCCWMVCWLWWWEAQSNVVALFEEQTFGYRSLIDGLWSYCSQVGVVVLTLVIPSCFEFPKLQSAFLNKVFCPALLLEDCDLTRPFLLGLLENSHWNVQWSCRNELVKSSVVSVKPGYSQCEQRLVGLLHRRCLRMQVLRGGGRGDRGGWACVALCWDVFEDSDGLLVLVDFPIPDYGRSSRLLLYLVPRYLSSMPTARPQWNATSTTSMDYEGARKNAVSEERRAIGLWMFLLAAGFGPAFLQKTWMFLRDSFFELLTLVALGIHPFHPLRSVGRKRSAFRTLRFSLPWPMNLRRGCMEK